MLRNLAILVLAIATSSCAENLRREDLTLATFPHPVASPAPARSDVAPGPSSITVTIDETGGVVELAGGPRLVVPPHALASARTISITRLGDRYPVGGISPAYTFSPHDITFAVPATVSFPGDGDIMWRSGAAATRLGARGEVTHLGTVHLVSAVVE